MPKYSLYKNRRKRYRSFKASFKLVKTVKRLVKRDIHYNDVTSTASVSTVPTVVLLNGVASGSNLNNRLGNVIYNRSLQAHFNYHNADTSNQFRTMVIYDQRPTGVLPTAAELFEVPGDPINSLLKINNCDRFKIITDFYTATDTDDEVTWKSIKGKSNTSSMMIPKFAQYTRFDATTSGGIANIVRGNLYLVLISDSNAITHPTVNYYCRLRFAA